MYIYTIFNMMIHPLCGYCSSQHLWWSNQFKWHENHFTISANIQATGTQRNMKSVSKSIEINIVKSNLIVSFDDSNEKILPVARYLLIIIVIIINYLRRRKKKKSTISFAEWEAFGNILHWIVKNNGFVAAKIVYRFTWIYYLIKINDVLLTRGT